MYRLTEQDLKEISNMLANIPIFAINVGQAVQSASHAQSILDFINSKKEDANRESESSEG